MRLPIPARRTLLAAAIALAAPVVGFLLVRPAIERAARTRIEREARALGLSATIGTVRLTPWLSLELGDVVVEYPGRVSVRSRSVVVGPRLSPLGLVGRAVHVATTGVLADLPGGVRLDLAPADWVVESRWRSRRIALLSRGEALEITVARDSGALRVEARAAAARLSQRLRVLLHGCPVASLGTVDGGAQVERSATGDVRVALDARARGLAFVSLDDVGAGCAGAELGAPIDVELQAEAVVRPADGLAAGRARPRRGRRGRGLTANRGGRRHRAAGRRPAARRPPGRLRAPPRDGGSRPAGGRPRLGDARRTRERARCSSPPRCASRSSSTSRRPARPLPSIERLKGPFVHTAGSRDGRRTTIRVSPESPDFVPLAEVPPLFVRALLIGEDADFYGHPGIDLAELPAALATNLARGTFARGASTITQQLAKNLFLSRRKTLGRKLEEASLALLLDSCARQAARARDLPERDRVGPRRSTACAPRPGTTSRGSRGS